MESIPIEKKLQECYMAVDYDHSFHIYNELPRRFERDDDKEWLGAGARLVGCDAIGYEMIPKELRDLTWKDEPVRMVVEKVEYITFLERGNGLAE